MEPLGKAVAYAALVQAVKDCARLRPHPSVMTVATIVVSLLSIMESHRQGAEVMQPLATPVIGGTISLLFHILTPVIFIWLRGREFNKADNVLFSIESKLFTQSPLPRFRENGLRLRRGTL